jgi:hypothetical protein
MVWQRTDGEDSMPPFDRQSVMPFLSVSGGTDPVLVTSVGGKSEW